jgi:hypothetical protein
VRGRAWHWPDLGHLDCRAGGRCSVVRLELGDIVSCGARSLYQVGVSGGSRLGILVLDGDERWGVSLIVRGVGRTVVLRLR